MLPGSKRCQRGVSTEFWNTMRHNLLNQAKLCELEARRQTRLILIILILTLIFILIYGIKSYPNHRRRRIPDYCSVQSDVANYTEFWNHTATMRQAKEFFLTRVFSDSHCVFCSENTSQPNTNLWSVRRQYHLDWLDTKQANKCETSVGNSYPLYKMKVLLDLPQRESAQHRLDPHTTYAHTVPLLNERMHITFGALLFVSASRSQTKMNKYVFLLCCKWWLCIGQ